MSDNDAKATVQAVAGQTFTKIEIVSDGLGDGTKILLNGKEIPNLNYLTFSFSPKEQYYPKVGLYFSTTEAASPGELEATTSYSLVPASARASASIQQVDTPVEQLSRGQMQKAFSKI